METKHSRRTGAIRPEDFTDDFPRQFLVPRGRPGDRCVAIRHDEFRSAPPDLFRDGMTYSRHLRLSEGVRVDAQGDVRALEPLADVMVESEFDQTDWIHWWDKGRYPPDRLFSSLVEAISCGDGEEQRPVILRGSSPAAAVVTLVRNGTREVIGDKLPVIERVEEGLEFRDGYALMWGQPDGTRVRIGRLTGRDSGLLSHVPSAAQPDGGLREKSALKNSESRWKRT